MIKISSKKIKEVTPLQLGCVVGACPSIFKTEHGTYLIVGKTNIDPDSFKRVQKKIGKNETVIEIPAELIDQL